MSEIVNNIEIRFSGLQRSGNHAVINWIANQAGNKVCFLNNVLPLNNVNPFKSCYNNVLTKFSEKIDIKSESLGKFTFKDCLIHNYEDQLLTDVASTDFENNHDLYVGKSLKRFDVIILRDPFNMFASRLSMTRSESGYFNDSIPLDSIRYRDVLVAVWKMYAKEYLKITNSLNQTKIPINFNKWVIDIEYRKLIISKLGLIFTDKGFKNQSVPSSFENQDKALKNTMGIFNRWKSFKDDEFYKGIFKDLELIHLSKRIFGDIADTNVLYD